MTATGGRILGAGGPLYAVFEAGEGGDILFLDLRTAADKIGPPAECDGS